MQKILTGSAIALAAITVAAFAGYQYVTHRALNEVETGFNALRATGVTASHGAVSFSPWSRTLRIDDVAIASAGDQASDVKIRTVTINAVNISGKDFAAQRIDMTDFNAKVADTITPGSTSRVSVPKITMLKPRLSPPLPDAGTATDPVAKAIASMATLNVASVSVPSLTAAMSIVPPPQARSSSWPPPGAATASGPVSFDYTASNIQVDDMAAGKIGRVAIEKGTLAGAPGSSLKSGTIGAISLQDIDLLPAYNLGLATRTPVDGFYKTQGKASIAGVSLQFDNGAEMEIGALVADGGSLDPSKASRKQLEPFKEALKAFQEKSAKRPPSPAEAQAFSLAMAETMGPFYQGLSTGIVEVRSFRFAGPTTGPTVNLGIGSIKMGPTVKGKVEEVRISDVSGSNRFAAGPPTPIKLGTFALAGLDLPKIFGAAGRLAPTNGQPPSPDAVISLLEGLEGFDLAGITLPDPKTGKLIQVDTFKASWGQFINSVPTAVRLAFKGSVPVNDPSAAMLRQAGFTALQMQADVSGNWTESDKVYVGKGAMAVERLGGLTTTLSFGNVPRTAFSLVPGQFAATVPTMEIGPLELALKDTGAIKLFAELQAASLPKNNDPTAPKPDPIAPLRQMLIDPASPNGNMPTLLDAVGRFIATPGQSLSIKLIPKKMIQINELTALDALQRPTVPAELLERFSLDVNVAR